MWLDSLCIVGLLLHANGCIMDGVHAHVPVLVLQQLTWMHDWFHWFNSQCAVFPLPTSAAVAHMLTSDICLLLMYVAQVTESQLLGRYQMQAQGVKVMLLTRERA